MHHAVALSVLAAPPGGSTAAPPAGGAAAGPLNPKLETVDAGVADRNGLDTSTRMLPIDLRLPTGFSSVYRVPGRDDMLMRGNGALYAVFAQSTYRRSARGAIPITPAGVVYSIGLPGGADFPGGTLRAVRDGGQPSADARVDLRVKPVSAGAARGEFSLQSGVSQVAAIDRATGDMPAICEAARAKAAALPATPQSSGARESDAANHRVKPPITDLELGPARVTRE
jgi:hypothetical protein